MQLASWDTRREFWLQTDYYKQRMVGNSKADAALLDEMINNIQFIPGDFTRAVNDSVKLIAETAPDANNLLRQYVAFASQRAASHLNDELKGAWAARTIQMKAQVKRQEEVAKAIYDRRMNSIEQALKIAEQHNISRSATDVPAEELPDSEMFLLGRPMLQARLENLQAVGPAFDLDYDQNRAMLNTLNVGPTLDPRFQTYRYLRTPEEPVKRDSPRRAFLMIMWGIVGGLIGWCRINPPLLEMADTAAERKGARRLFEENRCESTDCIWYAPGSHQDSWFVSCVWQKILFLRLKFASLRSIGRCSIRC